LFVPGAEVVDVVNATEEAKKEVKGKKRKRADSEEDDSDDDWENVVQSSDEEEDVDDETLDENGAAKKKPEYLTLEEKKQKAAEVTSSRFLTDADFKRIDAAQMRKQVQGFRKGGKKRKVETYDVDETTLASCRREELVDLANIEMVHKKRKHDKESR
jgi:protein SDA1